MKLFKSLLLAALICTGPATFAQNISKDSLKTLKYQQEAIKINKELNGNKIKLAALQAELINQNADASKNNEKAQDKADGNGSAAERLKADPQNVKLANKADDAASDAKSATNKAKKANGKSNELSKDITSLQKKISKQEAQLAAVPGYPFN